MSGIRRLGGMPLHLLAVAGLIVIAVALVWERQILAIADGVHDDQLMAVLAQNILQGKWLGDYNELTLVKGPGYPLFVALNHVLGVPLIWAERLLRIVACLAVFVALRGVLPAYARVVIFAVLLFHPVFYFNQFDRVYRDGFYTAMVLLLFAGSVGVARAMAENRWRAMWLWAALQTVVLAVCWITREEGIWLIPLMLLFAGWGLYWVWRHYDRDRKFSGVVQGLLVLILPMLGVMATLSALATINAQVYGVHASNEFRETGFPDAYGALVRVEPDSFVSHVPVPKHARESIYPLSPAMRELHSSLESTWVGVGCSFYPQSCNDIAGGWFVWALRTAATDAGHMRSAGDADAYFSRLAGEINALCDAGQLTCAGPRSGLAPIIRSEHVPALIGSLAKAFHWLLLREALPVQQYYSQGTVQGLAQFQWVSGGPVAISGVPISASAEKSIAVLAAIGVGYQRLTAGFALFAVPAFIWLVWLTVTRRRSPLLLLVAGGALLVLVTRAALLALIDATSFPMFQQYLGPAYPMVALFILVSLLAVLPIGRRALHDPLHPGSAD